jgi:hypothetical protein
MPTSWTEIHKRYWYNKIECGTKIDLMIKMKRHERKQ